MTLKPIRGYGRAAGIQGAPPREFKTTVACPLCSAPMRVRTSRHGEFYSCTTYPLCTGTRNLKQYFVR
jgi:ssDNA-binding Zn-finger/Zn-ribbon topoisomerase 1